MPGIRPSFPCCAAICTARRCLVVLSPKALASDEVRVAPQAELLPILPPDAKKAAKPRDTKKNEGVHNAMHVEMLMRTTSSLHSTVVMKSSC